MAVETKQQSFVWGADCNQECIKANHPHDAYLKLYKKKYKKSTKRNKQTKKKKNNTWNDTINILNPSVHKILFDTFQWEQLFKYKHKNTDYLKRQTTQTFYEWYCGKYSTPNINARNQIAIISMTDNKHYIDKELLSILNELVQIFYGLKIKYIEKIKNNELSLNKNEFGNFVSDDMHTTLSKYYLSDNDLFCVVGISYNIGIYSNKNNVVHGESNEGTQTSVCSFSKLGIYNNDKIPNWLKIRRSAKILLHEIGHLFGIGHCEYFKCLMNHNVVLDTVPMILCPICLNKLYFAMIKHNKNGNNTFISPLNHENKRNDDKNDFEFDLLQRYQTLYAWFTKYRIFAESNWYQNRINSLNIS